MNPDRIRRFRFSLTLPFSFAIWDLDNNSTAVRFNSIRFERKMSQPNEWFDRSDQPPASELNSHSMSSMGLAVCFLFLFFFFFGLLLTTNTYQIKIAYNLYKHITLQHGEKNLNHNL